MPCVRRRESAFPINEKRFSNGIFPTKLALGKAGAMMSKLLVGTGCLVLGVVVGFLWTDRLRDTAPQKSKGSLSFDDLVPTGKTPAGQQSEWWRHTPVANPSPSCPTPYNSTILHAAKEYGHRLYFSGSCDQPAGHRIRIKNGTSSDAIVKLRRLGSDATYLSFLVAKGGEAEQFCLHDGEYYVLFAFGHQMDRACKNFSTISAANKFQHTVHFYTQHEVDRTISNIMTFTLYPVADGNAPTSRIDTSEFSHD